MKKEINWLRVFNCVGYNIIIPVMIGSMLGSGSLFFMVYLGHSFKFAFCYSYILATLTSVTFVYIYNRNNII